MGRKLLQKIFAERFDIPEVKVSRAQAGDIVLAREPIFMQHEGVEYEHPMGLVLGVVNLSARTFLTAYIGGGWTEYPISEAVRVWRI